MSNDSNEAIKSTDDLIFNFVFIESMDDATKQKAYNCKKAWLKKPDNFPKSTSALKSIINSILKGKFKEQTEYDKEFIRVAHIICDEINDKKEDYYIPFRFGNAQKLINMVIKHYYIVSYNNSDIKKHFEFCHCPMDRQLLMKVWNEYKKEFSKKPSQNCNNQDEFSDSWGSLDFKDDKYPERYNDFQNAVKELSEQENISRLEYDFKEWNND